MNKCKRCGKENPAEVHTCTPGFYFTEHEKLKAICDKIGYKDKYIDFNSSFGIIRKWKTDVGFRILNVREIIFTQEFMDKIKDYLDDNNKDRDDLINLLNHLDNPVSYIYNLITHEGN